SNAASEISSSTTDLSQRTEEQAASPYWRAREKAMRGEPLWEFDMSDWEGKAGALFYLIEEATNNARKYAEAELITVQGAIQNDAIVIKIADNGKGFDSPLSLTGGGPMLYFIHAYGQRTHR
ncbi:MAG: hypothetical protein DPW09_33605, partial [Anaerolineae bacterium]|nr:hypothetical protein [Anaerolineae bacterium]